MDISAMAFFPVLVGPNHLLSHLAEPFSIVFNLALEGLGPHPGRYLGFDFSRI